MTKHYHLVIDDEGDAYLETMDGERLEPGLAKWFASEIIRTANRKLYVYIGYSETKKLYKIGFSKNPEKRALKLGIEIVHTIKCDAYGKYSARNVERKLHQVYKAVKLWRGNEWVDLSNLDLSLWRSLRTPTECLYQADEILNYFDDFISNWKGMPTDAELWERVTNMVVTNFERQIAIGFTLRYFAFWIYSLGHVYSARNLYADVTDILFDRERFIKRNSVSPQSQGGTASS